MQVPLQYDVSVDTLFGNVLKYKQIKVAVMKKHCIDIFIYDCNVEEWMFSSKAMFLFPRHSKLIC